ncbi:hypothetical protein ATO6_00270 [Oceanicola sp. 22II-s10i]|uniref:hypothetical protein n=1 Tax=Oceanicola sp. 22II-s10i TaxID=1317116 RepID=UPI000B6581BF|nr:hypothetical protein [Oceanicola sp. 22II-s10i]OWU85430.1 hypothetical protein ATO6_00270 [Oceanicola sp. 22II-s10i]
MLRFLLAALALITLAACAGEGERRGSASPEEVSRAVYRHGGTPSLTLYTIVSNSSGSGGHTALHINASQSVIFDPAGSFHHPKTPRRGDVLYGITPAFVRGYESMHARETYHVVAQRITVSPEVAERALQLALTNGAVGQAQCASATSALLRQLPGFEGIAQTMYPVTLQKSFQSITGVQGRRYYEDAAPPAGVMSLSAPAF